MEILAISLLPVLLSINNNSYFKVVLSALLAFLIEPATGIFIGVHVFLLVLITGKAKKSMPAPALLAYHLCSFLLWHFSFSSGSNDYGMSIFFLLSLLFSLVDPKEFGYSNKSLFDKMLLALVSLTIFRFFCPLFEFWSQIGLEIAASLNFVQAWITLLSFSLKAAFELMAIYIVLSGVFSTMTLNATLKFAQKNMLYASILFHIMLTFLLLIKFSPIITITGITSSIVLMHVAFFRKTKWLFLLGLVLLYGLFLGPPNIERLSVLAKGVISARSIFMYYNEWYIIWSVNSGLLTLLMITSGLFLIFKFFKIPTWIIERKHGLRVVLLVVLLLSNMLNIDKAYQLYFAFS